MDIRQECERLRFAPVEELLGALEDDRSYDANEGDVHGGPWPVSVSQVAAELLAEKGATVLPRLVQMASTCPGAARALALSCADLEPCAERLLRIYQTGPERVAEELAPRLATMEVAERVNLERYPERALELLRLADRLEPVMPRIPELLRNSRTQKAALDALYVHPKEPWLGQSRAALVAMLEGPFAERAAETLGFLRDGSPELADLALSAPTERLAGVALAALARAPAEKLDPLLDRLLAVRWPGQLMRVLRQAAQPRTRPFIEEFLREARGWEKQAAEEALSALQDSSRD